MTKIETGQKNIKSELDNIKNILSRIFAIVLIINK